MAKFDVNYQGFSNYLKKIEGMGEKSLVAIDEVMAKTALEFRSDLVRTVQGGYGDIPRHNRRKRQVADLVDTGAFVRSWVFAKEGNLKYSVSTNVAYAGFLEFGTSKMRAFRPVRRALIRVRPKFRKLVDNVYKGLKR